MTPASLRVASGHRARESRVDSLAQASAISDSDTGSALTSW